MSSTAITPSTSNGNSQSVAGPELVPGAPAPPGTQSTAPTQQTGWIEQHWAAGVTGGLVLLEAFVLFVCVVDFIRFELTGLSASAAWGLLAERPSFEKWAAVTQFAFVFAVFLLPLPAANAGLLAALRHLSHKDTTDREPAPNPLSSPPAKRHTPDLGQGVPPAPFSAYSASSHRFWKACVSRGKLVWAMHVLLGISIAYFTVLLANMQVLRGNSYSTGTSLHPAFFSLWLKVVSGVQWFTPAFFLPVLRKYLLRMFGGEHPHFNHILKEIFTEDLGVKE